MQAPRVPSSRAIAAHGPGGGLTTGVLVIGLAGSLLIAASELATIVSVDVLTGGTCEELADPASRDACKTTGLEQHGGALLLLGALAIAMTLGAARRASRPAAVALLAIAGLVIALTVLRDIPKADDTGPVGLRYEEAEARPGAGLYMEVIGAGLCALAGAARLTRSE